MIWLLGVFIPTVSSQQLWVGKTLAAKFALKSGVASTSTVTGATTVQTAAVKSTVILTADVTKVIQATIVKAAGVVVTTQVTRATTLVTAAAAVRATTLVRRDRSGIIPTGVPESSFRSAADIKTNVLNYLDKQNEWFAEKKNVVDQTKLEHFLYPRQATTSTIAAAVSGTTSSTTDPITGMFLPGVYGAHILFLIIGFSCCLLLPLLPDGRRAIDEDNPFGNMTAEEIATAHLKNPKNKRATSIFRRMTRRMTFESNRNTANMSNVENNLSVNDGPIYKKNSPNLSNMGDYDKRETNYSKGGYSNKQSLYSSYEYDKNDYKQSMYNDPRGKSVYDESRGKSMYDDPRGKSMYDDPRGKSTYDDPRGKSIYDDPRGKGINDKNDRYTRNDDDIRGTNYQAKPLKSEGSKKGNMVPMKGGDGYDDQTTAIVMMVVIRAYRPTLEDEVDLEPGDVIEVEEQFEDGWGVGTNTATKEFGAFPLSCLAKEQPKKDQYGNYDDRTIGMYEDKWKGGKKDRMQSIYGSKNATINRKAAGKETNAPGKGKLLKQKKTARESSANNKQQKSKPDFSKDGGQKHKLDVDSHRRGCRADAGCGDSGSVGDGQSQQRPQLGLPGRSGSRHAPVRLCLLYALPSGPGLPHAAHR
ncbi:Sorbin and SH3 domain-containing protein 2 [Nowakowskiella sp. JEL0078]|nr:Sorbin and SH3 domain-containing protein 2 [Nowakowskiella sp. JEL0078]